MANRLQVQFQAATTFVLDLLPRSALHFPPLVLGVTLRNAGIEPLQEKFDR